MPTTGQHGWHYCHFTMAVSRLSSVCRMLEASVAHLAHNTPTKNEDDWTGPTLPAFPDLEQPRTHTTIINSSLRRNFPETARHCSTSQCTSHFAQRLNSLATATLIGFGSLNSVGVKVNAAHLVSLTSSDSVPSQLPDRPASAQDGKNPRGKQLESAGKSNLTCAVFTPVQPQVKKPDDNPTGRAKDKTEM